VKARLDLAASDLGPTRLKNIAEPVRIYSLNVRRPGFVPALDWIERRSSRFGRLIKGITALTVIVGGAWYFLHAPPVRGMTDNEIRFGISAPFTGSANERQPDEARHRNVVQSDQRRRRDKWSAAKVGRS
jgi:hypothetical protein